MISDLLWSKGDLLENNFLWKISQCVKTVHTRIMIWLELVLRITFINLTTLTIKKKKYHHESNLNIPCFFVPCCITRNRYKSPWFSVRSSPRRRAMAAIARSVTGVAAHAVLGLLHDKWLYRCGSVLPYGPASVGGYDDCDWRKHTDWGGAFFLNSHHVYAN